MKRFLYILSILSHFSLLSFAQTTSSDAAMSGELDEITVVGEGDRKQLDLPHLGMEHMSIETIKLMPAMFGEVDVIKSIQLLPGVVSASEGSSAYNVRGGTSAQNLVLFDGATIYNPSHFLGFFSVFNNDVVSGATLYKGDMPAQYGGRLSSVLEVKTKEASNERFHGQGGIGLISSRILFEGPLIKDKLTGFIAGRVFYAGMFLPLVNRLKNTRLTFFDVNAKLSAKISDKHRLYFTGYAGRDYLALVKTGDFAYSNYAATAHWNAIVNEIFFINTHFLFSLYDYKGAGKLNNLSGEWTSKIYDYGLKQEYNWIVDSHNVLKFGLSTSYKYMRSGDASMSDTNSGSSLAVNIQPTHSLESGIFASNDQKYGPVSLNYGLRVSMFNNIAPQTELILDSNHKRTGTKYYESGIYNTYCELEPRFGISWEFYKNMSLKASYSRTAQYIHLVQTSTAGSPLDIWRASNPNLKPEICNQVSGGYVCNFYKDQFQVSVEGYYKWLNNVVDFKDYADVMLNEYIDEQFRTGKGRSYGVEFMLRRDYGKVTGWVSYTYSRSFLTIDGVNSGQEYSSTADRPHTVNIVLNYKINKWIDVGATWVYATGQPMSAPDERFEFNDFGYKQVVPLYSGRNKYRMPDYHRLDLAVTFDLNKGVVKRYNHNINISLYNVYCRHNAWMMSFETDPQTNSQYAELTYLFSIVPSITYNLSF